MRAELSRPGLGAPRDGAARIAVGLLDLLAEEQQVAARERALLASGLAETSLRSVGASLPEAALVSMLRAAPVDSAMARRLGRCLVQTRSLGLGLRYSGVATPEKAYRRCDQLLAREGLEDTYESAAISAHAARIVFHRRDAAPDPLLCSVREGMLQAVPSLFGLPAAGVAETACRAKGAPECVFEVRWREVPRAGLRLGAVAGALAGGTLAVWLGFGIVAAAGLTAVLAIVVGAAGRSFDLAKQVRALAAHQLDAISLVDQADGALAQRIDELAKIDSILDLAGSGSPGRGALRHRRPRTDLAAVVRRAADSVRASGGPPVDVELDLDEDETIVHGDAFQLEQMVTQLLRNAIQAAGQQPDGHVAVMLRRGEAGIEIAIQDNGAGIDPDVIDRVFDPFLEPPVAGSDSGFGLPVSYRIVQAHGGELRVEGEPGSGTRVSVWLPADLVEPATAP